MAEIIMPGGVRQFVTPELLAAMRPDLAPGFAAQQDQPDMAKQQAAQDQEVQARHQMSELLNAILGPQSVDLGGGGRGLPTQASLPISQDPRVALQEMERLGLISPQMFVQNAQKTLLGEALDRLGLTPGASQAQRQLSKERELARFKSELERPERERKGRLAEERLGVTEQRLKLAQEQQAETQRQFGEREARIRELAEQAREARLAPTIPPQLAQSLLDAMAQEGATPEQLQNAMQAMGYPTAAGTRRVGGFLGLGGTEVPVIGAPVTRGQAASGGTSAPGQPSTQQAARVVVEKAGKRFSLPVSQLEAAQRQGYKLINK